MKTPEIFKLKNLSPAARNIIFFVVVAIICVVLWTIYKKAKQGTKAVGEVIGNVLVEQQTGVSVARQNVLLEAAKDAHYAIWGYSGWRFWESWSEDEQRFIKNLNQIKNANEAALFSQYYRQLEGGRSVKADADDYLSDSERRQITYYSNLR